MTYIIIGIIALGAILFLTNSSKSDSNYDELYMSTASQSNDRIEKLGLNKPSEDVSHILDEDQLQFPKVEKSKEEVEYKANPNSEWIIEVTIPKGKTVNQEKLYELFNLEWRTNFSSTIFGHSPENNKWTYALAGNAPKTFDKIQVAISLLDLYSEKNPNYDFKKLERYTTELEKRLIDHSLNYNIQETESKKSAIEKSKRLFKLKELCDQEILIVLQSENKYSGIKAWDALQSLGLRWGDGDLFHWNNNSDYGSDQHFSVWTSTEPGYFFPEEIKNGKMNPNNLIFGFSIPRSADPVNIYQTMVSSIKYCQNRLGGQIITAYGEPFDELLEKKELKELVDQMKTNGIIPGSDDALMLF